MDLFELVDIISIIIDFLPTPDTRNLLRCCEKLYLLRLNKNILSIIDIYSLNWLNKLIAEFVNPKCTKFPKLRAITVKDLSQKEKYTFEIICYGYSHLLFNRYITLDNYPLHRSGFIRLHVGYNNFLDYVKFMIQYIDNFNYYTFFGAMINNNLKILKYLDRHGYIFPDSDLHFAVESRQLQVLKWAKINGYYIGNRYFQYN